jgi:hypothetical protein
MKSVLVTGARAPVALHWARVLCAAGHRVILADTHRFPMSRATRFKAVYVRLPQPRGNVAAYTRAVAKAVTDYACDLVVPTCEEVFFLAAARDLHGAAIPLFAPPFPMLEKVHNKYSFAIAAHGFGADPPATSLLASREDLHAIARESRDLVFKPVWSRFAERVLIRPAPDLLATTAPSQSDPWVAQAFLPGEELCSWTMAREGRLLASQAYRPLYRAGQGASLAFEPIRNEAIASFVAGFVASAHWTGQISFDFRHDANGRLSAIECNPRATSGLHYFGPADRLDEALFAGSAAAATLNGPMTLPLAMLVYGLPFAFGSHAVGRWLKDFRAMGDISRWPGDRSLLPAQFLALAEIALAALSRGASLKAAATADIEWNGEPLGPR